MKLNNNVTLVTAVVAGTKVIINTNFQMTRAGAEALAAECGITMVSWMRKWSSTSAIRCAATNCYRPS
jgi:hypothetical protein